MKKIYQIVPIAIGIGLLGCSDQQEVTTEPQTENVTETETQGTPDTNTEPTFVSQLPDSAPTYKVATTGIMPPFSFQDENGTMQGIDIDTIRAIGETQGFKVEFYKESWQDLFESVSSGERDIAISGISYSDDRAQKYGLSDSYFFNPSAIMYANQELSINGLDDLTGLKVGGMEGSKQVGQVEEMGGASEVVTTSTTYLLFERLVQGKVDAIVQDLPLLQYTAANYPEQKVTLVPYEDENNPEAQQVILMAKGNTELINSVNEGIAKLKQTNEFEEIENRWITFDDGSSSKIAEDNNVDDTVATAN